MGNNKFKFSDMIPNAWFYKLKDMSKSTRKRNVPFGMKSSTKATSPTTSQRSFPMYGKLFNTPIKDLDDDIIPPFNDFSPRRSSSKRRPRRKTIYKPSPNWTKPIMSHQVMSQDYDNFSSPSSYESNHDFNEYASSESDCDGFSVPDLLNGVANSNCSCRVSSSTNDIIIDMMNNESSFQGNYEKKDGFDAFSQLGLAPILTKPVKFDEKIIEGSEYRSSTESDEPLRSFAIKEGGNRSHQRRRKSSHVGIRLRVNSPKLASKKIQGCGRKSVSRKGSRNGGFPDGFAVVKSSMDPIGDFKESMVEMIVENNIRASKDLEDLLACYLSLNSSEYHDLIVKAFEQIWYDMAQLRM